MVWTGWTTENPPNDCLGIPVSLRVPASVALRGASGKFDADPGEEFHVRGIVSASEAMAELASDPVLRGLRAAPDKMFGMALASMPGWSRAGNAPTWIGGVKALWYVRDGNKTKARWVLHPWKTTICSADLPGAVRF